jgi:hypothetical protein
MTQQQQQQTQQPRLADQVSGIRLSERERAALSKAMGIHSGAERRRHTRYLLPKEFTLVVRLQQPGGGAASLMSVTPRDLSSSGIGFFHAAYMHPGTACTLMMRDVEANPISLKGTVVRCRHVSGRIHEVGVLFEHEVDVKTFVTDTSKTADDPSKTAALRLEEIHARLGQLAMELKDLADQRAAPGALLAKVGELALLIAPPEPPEATAEPKPEPKA